MARFVPAVEEAARAGKEVQKKHANTMQLLFAKHVFELIVISVDNGFILYFSFAANVIFFYKTQMFWNKFILLFAVSKKIVV